MNPPADSQTRTAALDPTRSFIVRAPAGSGKTELLISRYLKLLAGVRHPEEIVAITFTRKAAAEMRSRIISALQDAADGHTPNNTADYARQKLAQKALARDTECGWRLREYPARLRIQTIDSLSFHIAAQMPVLSALGGVAGARESEGQDADAHYLEAARRSLLYGGDDATWVEAARGLLTHLDNDLARAGRLLAMLLGHRDQWLRYFTAGQLNRDKLDQAFDRVTRSTLERARELFPDETKLADLLAAAAPNLPDSPLAGCADPDTLPPSEPEQLALWQAIVGVLLTKDNRWRRSVDKRQGFPPGTEYKEYMLALLECYADCHTLRDVLELIRALPVAEVAANGRLSWFHDRRWQTLQHLLTLAYITARVELPKLFSERGMNDFIGVQQAALQALGDDDAPTDLALRLDYHIEHLLVDEFQDVSVSQYRLFEKLTGGWSEGDGRTLFLVGDPMQSIYRFREAEVGNYLRVFEHGCLGQVRLEALTLTVNFRSQAAVVTWVNRCFKMILPEQQDIASGAVAFSAAVPADTGDSNTRAIIVHPLVADKTARDEEAERIVEIVQATAADKSIALLVYQRSQLDVIVAHLRRSGIGFQAVDIEPLGERVAIQECLALSRALLHPADRAAWLAMLRAPWCGLTLADLTTLVGDDRRTAVWRLMQDKPRLAGLSDDGRRRLDQLRSVLAPALAARRHGRFSRLVEKTWIALGAPATLADATDIDNVRTFFAALEQQESGGSLANFDALAMAVGGLYATMNTGGDAARIQIMTMHKAKGLEFDVVILPDLGRRGKSEERRLLRWHEQPRTDGGADLLLAPVGATGDDNDDPLYHYLNVLEKIQAGHERARLLYVATTRARETLHLFGTARVNGHGEPSPTGNTLLAKLWPMVETDYRVLRDHQQSATAADPTYAAPTHPLRRLRANWSPPPPPTAPAVRREHDLPQDDAPVETVEYAWASETIRCVGTVVHHALEIMATDGLWTETQINARQDWLRRCLRQQGITDERITTALRQVKEALRNTLRDARGRWILSADHREARSEYALTGAWDRRIVSIKIDRTFVDADGTRWIIDYKTSRHENTTDHKAFLDQQQERYRKQLEKYAALMRAQDDRPIMLGLYFPLLQDWREWAFDDGK